MFTLHPQLEKDCFQVGDLPLCRVLLMNDCNYPWLILVPRCEGLREILELDELDQHQLLCESSLAGKLLQGVFKAEKLNIAALGNMVPQLHVHHIARYQHDAAWPGPVWGKLPAKPYSENSKNKTIETMSMFFRAQDQSFDIL